MTAFVIPHETHQTTARIWVAWWSRDWPRHSMGLSLRVEDPQGRVVARPDLEGWSSIGLEGRADDIDTAVCEYVVVSLTDLTPSTVYRLIVSSRFGQEAVGEVETLPDRIPDAGAERPFTVMFGSCYYAPEDPEERVAETYLRLARSRHRPHLKILCGDQVYVDQPAGPGTPMYERMSSDELRRWMIAKYQQTWQRLKQMLQTGANYLTSDDHEFWNNYPYRPLDVAWPALAHSAQYRLDWEHEALTHLTEIQQGRSVTRLDVGDDLSIFIADTRVNRQTDGVRFMSDDDFAAMIDWIRGLRTPGVLVLGQPILANPLSWVNIKLDRWVTDANLPYFGQYDDLMSALSWWCHHDLLILVGDVHFGRVARFDIARTPDLFRTVVHEVVSSGMKVLPSAKNRFLTGPSMQGLPYYFPPFHKRYWQSHGSVVTYPEVVPLMSDDSSGTENHFMTLEFARHPTGRGIDVSIRAWLVDREPEGDMPTSPWTYTYTLDGDRPASAAAMIAPPVLDFGEVDRDTSVTRDRALIVSSVGPVPVVIHEVRPGGSDSERFSVEVHGRQPLPVTLDPGETLPVTVRFRSDRLGEHEAWVEVVGGDVIGGGGRLRSSAMLAAEVTGPVLEVLPASVPFGLAQVGRPVKRSLAVMNTGSGELVFGLRPPAPDSPFGWPVARTERRLAAGGIETVPITFRPGSPGGHTDHLVLDAGPQTVKVPLSGEAVAAPLAEIGVSPEVLNFVAVRVGKPADLPLAVTNRGGAPLVVKEAVVKGAEGGLFKLLEDLPVTVQPGKSERLTVRFAPGAVLFGGYRAKLLLESNAANEPQLPVALFGATAAANLRAEPAELVFSPSPLAAALPPGRGSRKDVIVYNHGTAGVTVDGGSLGVIDPASGRPSQHFELLDEAGQPSVPGDLPINAGGFARLSVRFRPATAGNHVGEIRFAPREPSEPTVVVTVRGRGIST